jgi:hypothetical protein
MTETPRTYRALFLEAGIGTASTLLLGYLVYGAAVFSVHSHRFVFLMDGFIGAFTFSSLRRLGGRTTAALLFVMTLFHVILLTRSAESGHLLPDLLFFMAVPAATALFFWSYRKHLYEVKLGDPLLLGGFVAVSLGICRVALILRAVVSGTPGAWPVPPGPLAAEFLESFLIGLGLGGGLWIADRQQVRAALHLTRGFTKRFV